MIEKRRSDDVVSLVRARRWENEWEDWRCWV